MVSLEPNTNDVVYSAKPHVLVIILVSMAILLAFLYGSAVYMSTQYGPESDPISLRLESIRASNFNVTSSPLLANWTVEMGLGNRKENLRIDVEQILSLLYYRDHEISCASVTTPFRVLSEKQRSLELHFERKACGGEQPFLDDGVLSELVEERRKGRMRNLTMKMEMEVGFDVVRSSWSWQRRLRLYCPPMEVEFPIGKGEGNLASDAHIPIHCSLY